MNWAPGWRKALWLSLIHIFLFTDNTVGYEHNAQLMDDQKALFLEKAAPVLKSMTMGYGIWTYRDYGDNKLYNAQFGLGQEGWRFSGGSSVVRRGKTRQAKIPGGAGDVYKRQLGYPLLITQSGGAEGGSSLLTPKAKDFLVRFLGMEKELREDAQKLYQKYFSMEDQTGL